MGQFVGTVASGLISLATSARVGGGIASDANRRGLGEYIAHSARPSVCPLRAAAFSNSGVARPGRGDKRFRPPFLTAGSVQNFVGAGQGEQLMPRPTRALTTTPPLQLRSSAGAAQKPPCATRTQWENGSVFWWPISACKSPGCRRFRPRSM